MVAKARGADANLVNTERSISWSANHTRPLCPPEAGTCNGPGDAESASSFAAGDGGLKLRSPAGARLLFGRLVEWKP